MIAPLVLFAYNRPLHLEKTLKALSLNPEAKDSELFLFIDGPKKENDITLNKDVLSIAERYAATDAFKKVHITKREQNWGLAKSVISGVSEVINKFGQVIVTEDDSVPSVNYLKFMNDALDFYRKNEKIWSIGGYTVPMALPPDYKRDVILTQRSSSYAWATWKDRWEKIDWSVSDYKKFHWDFFQRKRFNLWGNDRSSMLDDQMLGRVNSWAIRFDYAMFKHGMYNIVPRESLIQNIGHDGSGTHSTTDSASNDLFAVELPIEERVYLPSEVAVDDRIRKAFNIPFLEKKRHLFKRFLGNLILERTKQHG